MYNAASMTVHDVCGIDEAGRGALAGPLVAAAVAFPSGFHLPNVIGGVPLRDGKTLSRSQRERIIATCDEFGIQQRIETVHVADIDKRGIGWANKEVFRRLIASVEAARYILDGNLTIAVRGKAGRIESVVDADATVPQTILAGIVAKVHRDRLMDVLHHECPRYGWNHNAGYGTREHITAIREFGTTVHHRRMFTATALGHIT